MKTRAFGSAATWTWPLALATMSFGGLLAALLWDGVADLASALALASPLLAALVLSSRRRR